MSSPQRGQLEIELDGVSRKWWLKWSGMLEIESALKQIEGKPVPYQTWLRRGQEWSIHDIGLALWAGLHDCDSSITFEWVMAHADQGTFVDFLPKFWSLGDRAPTAEKKTETVDAPK